MSSISPSHSLNRSPLFTTSATMRAPWTGGLLQMALASRFICDITRVVVSASFVMMLRAPTRSA